ncbi:MAG: helix-turn-helix domain-containing protein [Bacteroidales bacterium]|nr:helix-turn-helix domain-containing protein [Bacteroidales bacterium]
MTKEQRYTIEALLQTPMSLREIGEVIGVSTGTVSREIRRNCDMRGYHRYRWQLAQKKYERRMKTRRHYLKFTDEMKRTVRRFIIYGQYSPEQICGRFRLKGEEIRIPLDKQAILMFSIPQKVALLSLHTASRLPWRFLSSQRCILPGLTTDSLTGTPLKPHYSAPEGRITPIGVALPLFKCLQSHVWVAIWLFLWF